VPDAPFQDKACGADSDAFAAPQAFTTNRASSPTKRHPINGIAKGSLCGRIADAKNRFPLFGAMLQVPCPPEAPSKSMHKPRHHISVRP
jgi:hypothetical protein